MTDERIAPGKWRLMVLALAIVAFVSTIGLLLYSPKLSKTPSGVPVPQVEAGRELPAVEATGASADFAVPEDQLARIGIKYAEISSHSAPGVIRSIGTIQPNAYRETRITPIVAGRVVDVKASLGDKVRKGQVLATIFSPELSQEQMEYVKVEANLNLHVAQAERYRRLLEVGAVSLQEKQEIDAQLDVHHAEHASHRQKLKLMGLSDSQIDRLNSASSVKAEVDIVAPSSGVITQRAINPGQNISISEVIFYVTDLAQVWVIATAYEKDFAAMKIGGPAMISSASYPGRQFAGRVTYIDPRVDPATRTAQMRIEIPNPGEIFRLGMFVDVTLRTSENRNVLAVPKAAIQTLGNDSVAFVSSGTGRFRVAKLQLGDDLGPSIQLLSGLAAGEKVVTDGSFFLKAEMARNAH